MLFKIGSKYYTLKELKEKVGGLSCTTKMPGYSWGISAQKCKTGSKLAQVGGTVCSNCYALRGNYVWSNVRTAHDKRLHSFTNDADWVPSMATLINHYCKSERYFRWFDSGDLQSADHLRAIIKICKLTPNVKHWLATREWEMVRSVKATIPSNLNIRISAHKIDKEPPKQFMEEHTASMVGNTEHWLTARHSCPASLQDNKCGDCRKCWDKRIKLVTYKKH